MVESIEVKGGLVHVSLLTDRAHAEAMEPVRREVERLLAKQPGVQAQASPNGGLTMTAAGSAMDSLVLALGQSGIVIRRLELTMSPLESMFFALTEQAPGKPATAPGVARVASSEA